MPAGSLLQVLAVILGLACLGFFAFFGAYYLRNRRDALGASPPVESASDEVPGDGPRRSI